MNCKITIIGQEDAKFLAITINDKQITSANYSSKQILKLIKKLKKQLNKIKYVAKQEVFEEECTRVRDILAK